MAPAAGKIQVRTPQFHHYRSSGLLVRLLNGVYGKTAHWPFIGVTKSTSMLSKPTLILREARRLIMPAPLENQFPLLVVIPTLNENTLGQGCWGDALGPVTLHRKAGHLQIYSNAIPLGGILRCSPSCKPQHYGSPGFMIWVLAGELSNILTRWGKGGRGGVPTQIINVVA